MKTDKVEQELLLKIIENWGNAVVPISEMVKWLQEYASQSKQGWISVEDRLPEIDEHDNRIVGHDSINCIICDMSEGFFNPCRTATAWYDYKREQWTILYYTTGSQAINVTHWMPLAAPPTQDKEPDIVEDEDAYMDVLKIAMGYSENQIIVGDLITERINELKNQFTIKRK